MIANLITVIFVEMYLFIILLILLLILKKYIDKLKLWSIVAPQYIEAYVEKSIRSSKYFLQEGGDGYDCKQTTCPTPACGKHMQETLPGECCPTCKGGKTKYLL